MWCQLVYSTFTSDSEHCFVFGGIKLYKNNEKKICVIYTLSKKVNL